MYIYGVYVPEYLLWIVIVILAIPSINFFSGIFSRRVIVKKNPLVKMAKHNGRWWTSLD